MAVKIVVDSASDISESEAKELGITMIPMVITFGEEEFFDGVDLLPAEFYERLKASKDVPKTAQVTPYRFEELFSEETKNGDEVVAIVLSSRLSGTYEGAKAVAEKFNGKVHVVDSLNATSGERVLVLYALELAKQGLSAKEIYEKLEEKKKDIEVVAVIDTLEYLKKGGRVSSAVAFIGGMLNIKPLIRVIDGEVKMAGKARGQKKAIDALKEIIKGCGGIDYSMPYTVIWGGNDEGIAHTFIENNKDLWEEGAVVDNHVIASTIGTHVGPGALGVVFFKNN